MGTKNIPKHGRFCRPLPPVQARGRTGSQNDLLSESSQCMNPNEMIMKRSSFAKTLTIAAVSLLAVLAMSAQLIAQEQSTPQADHTQPVDMTFSGSNVATAIDLQPDTITDEVILVGNGTL